jgi:hypothetical protein
VAWDEVEQELEDLLRLVPGWRLRAGQWADVRDELARLRVALAGHDVEAVGRSVARLDELAPTRLGSMEDDEPDPTGPPPPVVAELIVEVQGVRAGTPGGDR